MSCIRIQTKIEAQLLRRLLCVSVLRALDATRAYAQDAVPRKAPNSSDAVCFSGAEGSTIPEPEDLRSEKGVLRADLAFRNDQDANGQMGYCYVAKDGSAAANLRLTVDKDDKRPASHGFCGGPSAFQTEKSAHGETTLRCCASSV